MIRSMTAFARREAELDAGTVSWELRSLNHRYLEVSLRLPEELRVLETAVRERVNARLARGKLDCTCRFQPAARSAIPVDIDTDNLKRLLVACETVSAGLPDVTPPDPVELLRWPGIVREQAPDTEPLRQGALELLDATLDELLASRAREGESIHALLMQRCDAMNEQVGRARGLMPDIRVGLRKRLEQRLAELEIDVDPGRLEQELVLQLQKVDVDEELDRLESHLGEVRRVIGSNEPVGRRLDFLMQELNREANTLGSKSVVTDTTGVSVELKVLIEQMREQVQNVE
ncbi:MAG: YicC/YloC family endoribonuclease [Thiohalobacterales bacterium]|nr:YicC/YloC family endoribonuclease [Thiohalobacterales bacterium]